MFGLNLPDGIVIALMVLAGLYALFMFFLPFFVCKIRNQTIRTNELLSQILSEIKPPQAAEM